VTDQEDFRVIVWSLACTRMYMRQRPDAGARSGTNTNGHAKASASSLAHALILVE